MDWRKYLVGRVTKRGETKQQQKVNKCTQKGLKNRTRKTPATSDVLGHDLLRELLGLVDDEAPAVGAPRDDVRVPVPLDLVQDGVQLEREGDRHPSPAAPLVGVVVVRGVVVVVLEGRRLVLAFVVVVRVVGVVVVVVHDKVPVVLLGRLARLLGLAAALGAGLGALVRRLLQLLLLLSDGAREEGGELLRLRVLAAGGGGGGDTLQRGSARGGGGHGGELGQGEAPEQPLRQDARAHLQLIGVQRHRLDSAVGGVGYAHGPLAPTESEVEREEEEQGGDDGEDGGK